MLTHDDTSVDEFIWLEEIGGEKPLAWVAEQNERTHQMLATPSFARTEQRILEVLDSDDRIPMVAKNGEFYYNFWRDAEHPRGLWRRTSLASYRTSQRYWDFLLDLYVLGRR
jgi:prolyl oligopeptidase